MFLSVFIPLPVIALAMQQRLGVAAERLYGVVRLIALLCIVQHDKEGCFLHSVQRLSVLALSEIGITGTRPGHPDSRRSTNE